MNGVVSHASYVPRYVLTRDAARAAWPRLPMAVSSRSVPALDEDAITMGAEAGLAALERAGIRGDDLAGVVFATESSPYVVKSAAAVVADYVNARGSVCVLDMGAGAQAGLLALVNALRDRELAERGAILVIAADAVFGEANDASDLGYGAAAAAFVVAAEGFATLQDFACAYSSYSNVWQAPGDDHLRRYDDERFDRASGYAAQMLAGVRQFVARLDRAPDWYALQLSGTADAARVASVADAGRVVGRDTVARIGDAGCANVLLALAQGLEKASPGDTILAQAYGAGTVTALFRLDADAPHAAANVSEDGDPVELSYVQYAKHRGLIPLAALPDMGAPFAASPAWERDKRPSIGLHGGRCTACGSLNFPPRAYCLDCRGEEFEDVQLPRLGEVVTYNVQYVVGIGPEEAPLPICTALLEDEEPGRYGGKVAALIADAELDSLRVGMKVRLVPRRGDVERGLVKYGWKFRPLTSAEAA